MIDFVNYLISGALIGLAVAYIVVPEAKVAASPRRDLIFGIWMFSGVSAY